MMYLSAYVEREMKLHIFCDFFLFLKLIHNFMQQGRHPLSPSCRSLGRGVELPV